MRAVTVGGMVSALEEVGLRDAFDGVFGSSAGAVAGAYFVAGQARFGTAMFYEHLNGPDFIDLYRPLCIKPIMDTGYLIDRVMRVDKKLNINPILDGDLPLHIVATDVHAQKSHVESHFDSEEDFFQFLRATVTMPLIGGGPVRFKDRFYYDGGLVQQIAVESAIAWGATHILALLSRRRSECDNRPRQRVRSAEAAVLHHLYGRRVGDLYRSRESTIVRSLDLCFSEHRQQELGVHIAAITLPETLGYLSRLTKDGVLLRRGERQAFETIRKLNLTNGA